MGKISLDLSHIKSAGIYTIEIDNSQRTSTSTSSLRLAVGFANNGPFNKPVLYQSEEDRLRILGDIDTKLEYKGCFFNRMIKTLVADGPVLGLNLLKVDDSVYGPDQVNYAALSLDAATPNPEVYDAGKYGQIDYLAESIDSEVYGTVKGSNIPYIGKVPYAQMYDRSRFWEPSKENLVATATAGINGNKEQINEYGNLLSFANIGTQEISVLVWKVDSMKGYDVTASTWYNGANNIPFGWIRPNDFMSDYLLKVVCVKGNWSNYPVLATDTKWGSYFDLKGIIKDKINEFITAEGIECIGSWVGSIIPDFTDKQGNMNNLEKKINAVCQETGLMMAFNEDAAHALIFDYSGSGDNLDEDAGGTEKAPMPGQWGYDIDGDGELTTDLGDKAESNNDTTIYKVDMVGHGVFMENEQTSGSANLLYSYVDGAAKSEMVGLEFNDGSEHTVQNIIQKNVFFNTDTLALLTHSDSNEVVKAKYVLYIDATELAHAEGQTFIDVDENGDALNPFYALYYRVSSSKANQVEKVANDSTAAGTYKYKIIDEEIIAAIKAVPSVVTVYPSAKRGAIYYDSEGDYYYVSGDENNYALAPQALADDDATVDAYVSGIYVKADFIDRSVEDVYASEASILGLIPNDYYTLAANGTLKTIAKGIKEKTVEFYNYNEATGKDDGLTVGTAAIPFAENNTIVSFTINDIKYFVSLLLTVDANGNIVEVAGGHYSYAIRNVISLENATHINGTYGASADSEDVTFGAKVFGSDNEPDYSVGYVTVPDPECYSDGFIFAANGNTGNVNFLSYNYVADASDVEDPAKTFNHSVSNVQYFGEPSLWESGNAPVKENDSKHLFIITSYDSWSDANIKVGDYVHNLVYDNAADSEKKVSDTNTYKMIPGLARVIAKQFVRVYENKETTAEGENTYNTVVYKGKSYKYNGECDTVKQLTEIMSNRRTIANKGFYLITCTEPVKIEDDNTISRQLPLSDDLISHSLRFIPLKGLKLTSCHKPGYDEKGNINIEAGVAKIYGVLEETGILRALVNKNMVDYRYIIDTMSYGLDVELGGKVFLSRLAQRRGKCTALLNLPSMKQFTVSTNPFFCDSYFVGSQVRPPFDTKYIPLGGNTEMGTTGGFSLPTEDDGAKFSAAFWPNLTYSIRGKKVSVPPSADVANAFLRKFTGALDPYAIVANQDGILRNQYLSGIEYHADQYDRDNLEPMGVNTIIQENGNIVIYGNQTCYQTLKTDMNKLHVRENLNTIEIECDTILRRFNFKYNTSTTRAAIVQMLTPVLSSMQTSGAIDKYEIICDETNNTEELILNDFGIVDIGVWFNHGMEKIVQRIRINKYGSDSSEE